MGQQPNSEQKPLIKQQHSAYDQISGAAPSAPENGFIWARVQTESQQL